MGARVSKNVSVVDGGARGFEDVTPAHVPNSLESAGENQEDIIEIKYSTWGTHGQFIRTLAVLKNGEVIDPKTAIWAYHDKIIKIEEKSSGKKINVYIKKGDVLAVIEEYKSSSGWKGFTIIYGDGEINVDFVTETNVTKYKAYHITYKVYYYVNKNIKVELKRERVEISSELIGKPKIHVSGDDKKVIVTGDTFHIKEQLKSLGFKWEPLQKYWCAKNINFAEVVKKLQEFAEVEEA